MNCCFGNPPLVVKEAVWNGLGYLLREGLLITGISLNEKNFKQLRKELLFPDDCVIIPFQGPQAIVKITQE